MSNFNVEAMTVPLRDIKLDVKGGVKNGTLTKIRCDEATIKGVGTYKVTSRFMSSLAGLMGLGNNVFRYFDSAEVFERVIKKANKHSRIQVSIDSNNKLLAAISEGRTPLGMDSFNQVVGITEPKSWSYDSGVVKLLYDVNYNGDMLIGGEDYRKQFTVTIPLDGYGEAASNLALLRQICENGMEMTTNLFMNRIGLGSKGKRSDPIINYIQNFNNDENYAILEDRLVTAMSSTASLREFNNLTDALQLGKNTENMELDRKIWSTLNDVANSPMKKYGLVSLDTLSDKKAMLLNTDCKVYDLVQFATEVSTHKYVGPLMGRRRKLDTFVSELVTKEYDLEVMNPATTVESTKLAGRQFFLSNN